MRKILSLILTLALILALFVPAATDAADPAPLYEVVVPLEFNQIYQVSSEHGLMVVERYGSYRDPLRSLVTFDGEEVLAGTEILLCSAGILCRTRDWSGENPPTELYSFYDWELNPVLSNLGNMIVPITSHYLLLIDVTSTSAHANLSYGQRQVYDLETGETTPCGYGSDGDEVTLPNGNTVAPDRYGFFAFAEEILTFLWRAAGEPEPSVGNPFYNVSEDAYYYKAALWASEQGMVSGTEFAGDEPCTRAMTVTFLWQYAGRPETGTATFDDIPADANYASAVAWAVETGVTNGTGNGRFSPETTCTRAQIVTFLYRAFGESK